MDPILIDMVEDKAKTLRQVTIEDVINHRTELPPKIPIRLNKDYEQRFNDLADSLNINRVQVIRNLLSGDEILVLGVCKKARAIKARPLQAVEIEQMNALPRHAPTGHLNTSQEAPEPQAEPGLIAEFCEENGQTPSISKRGRKKKVHSGIDHSEERRQIIEHLNQRTGKNFGSDTKEAINAIDKMLNEGKQPCEFIKIIDNMASVWLDNPKMNVRLCPETLFRPIHWEKYLNANSSIKTDTTQKDIKNKDGKYEGFYL